MSSQAFDNNVRLLQEGLDLLGTLNQSAYSMKSPLGASVGNHVRHIVDFYLSFLKTLPSGKFDYDSRSRDSEVEQNLDVAMQRISTILERLTSTHLDLDAECLCKTEASQPPEFSKSTIKRELQHLHAHTIHHYALISYVLSVHGVTVPHGFGVAPSTLAFLQEESLAG
ncbi:MAG: DinB family protein [Spirochaetia bacterium]|nr:DinB family protein [Spirochaetia bacterium]